MNHGRYNIPIRNCPDCGEKLNVAIHAKCNETMHTERRRQRSKFCYDCGVKLR